MMIAVLRELYGKITTTISDHAGYGRKVAITEMRKPGNTHALGNYYSRLNVTVSTICDLLLGGSKALTTR